MVDKSECWEWKGARTGDGYGAKAINGKQYKTHRLAYEWANGPIPDGLFVCHHCDNPPCCNPDHLFLGDTKANAVDMAMKFRHTFGEAVHTAKLTEKDVREILAGTENNTETAKKYNVTKNTIGHIRSGKTWKHVFREHLGGNRWIYRPLP